MKKITEVVFKIDSREQWTIPVAVRKVLNINNRSAHVAFYIEEDSLVLRVFTDQNMDELKQMIQEEHKNQPRIDLIESELSALLQDDDLKYLRINAEFIMDYYDRCYTADSLTADHNKQRRAYNDEMERYNKKRQHLKEQFGILSRTDLLSFPEKPDIPTFDAVKHFEEYVKTMRSYISEERRKLCEVCHRWRWK